MHAQPTTTTEQTTWLEIAYTPMGTKLAILQDRTANQIEHEYNAYSYRSGRPDYIYTHKPREADGAHYIIAFRADILKGARVTLRQNQIRLHIPATRGEHHIKDCSAYSPLVTDAYLEGVRDTVKLAKELVNA